MTADVHPIQLKPENSENVAGRWVTNDLLLRSALWHASTGRPVFPCCPWDGAFTNYKDEPIDGKAPLTRNGFHAASLDAQQIREWWSQYRFAMIGSPVPVDETCLDIDPRHDGDIWALLDLVNLPHLLTTCAVISGRLDGGAHHFFKNPHRGDYDGAKARLPRGVDLKDGGKGFTVLPPSVHNETGGVYFYRAGTRDLRAEIPIEIHRILLKPPAPKPADLRINNKPTAGRLAAICRKVAETPPGNRQTIAFQWAAQILRDNQYGPEAWALVEEAMRDAGASPRDITTALRERPGRERVHA
jgi:hypothetical protein